MIEKRLIIYDGDCGFCSNSIANLTRWLGVKAPKNVPFQTIQLDDLNITREDVLKAMYYVDICGRVCSGADAFRAIFWDAGSGWKVLSLTMSLPLVKQVSRIVYRKIAQNRQKLPGATESCGMK